MTREYATAGAFKQALEQRLRASTRDGSAFARTRQVLVFERFLARVGMALGDSVQLKGGFALELRIATARSTKDVDLRVAGSPDDIEQRLRELAREDVGDFMQFDVRPDPRHPRIQNEGTQYDGLRFRAECRLAGKIYGRPFGVDVAFGDPLHGEPAILVAEDRLAFAGIAPPTVRVYPLETHLAEKLHAYTMPRVRPNTRVKDLPDFALLASAGALRATSVRTAIENTFAFRSTHPVPTRLGAPPDAWAKPYASIAQEDGLPWATLNDVFKASATFMDFVLRDSTEEGAWDPANWSWSTLS